ncbi:cysteine hydrolase family protein [Geomicrobium sp. JCM 19055]|uniref:cysteine hydrolase family protein n=1 Tax=Geomicrobium sp. JCM 19055 TaxID=1460649 RepID=UPI00045EDB49|nr:isochorismatase family cysteine hydrolase [Geomicrobium sp. JCM 19055]GAJ99291.1 nicotinamidase [Geomicrobium sp. JCM 19055]
MSEALLVIDYTIDFVADHGKLTCGKPGQQIEPAIHSLIEQFSTKKQLVIYAVDLHEENDQYHPETKLFPPHNIKGTDGRQLYGSLQQQFEQIKAHSPVLYLDKTRYSAFAGTNLDMQLRARNITTVHLTGVCTDICVLHTAVDAYNLGYQIVVHEQAVQSFSSEGHTFALNHFKNSLGATIL